MFVLMRGKTGIAVIARSPKSSLSLPRVSRYIHTRYIPACTRVSFLATVITTSISRINKHTRFAYAHQNPFHLKASTFHLIFSPCKRPILRTYIMLYVYTRKALHTQGQKRVGAHHTHIRTQILTQRVGARVKKRPPHELSRRVTLLRRAKCVARTNT